MIRMSEERTRTLLAIHGWSAVFLGLLLYAVIVTGVASVFADEIGDWSSPLSGEVADPFPGGTLFALITPLHFGGFAGVFSKSVWFALGFSDAYVTITGLLLWTTRRQAQRRWRHLAAATYATGYGLPLGLALAGWAYFPARALGTDVQTAMMSSFLITLALACTLTWRVVDFATARRWLLGATGLALIALPLLRIACDGIGWTGALDAGLQTIVAFDLALVLGGGFCLWTLRHVPQPSQRAKWRLTRRTPRARDG